MSVTIIIADDALRAPSLLWDTTWDGFVGDWAPAVIDQGPEALIDSGSVDVFAPGDVFALDDVFARRAPIIGHRRPRDVFAADDVFTIDDVFGWPASTAEPSNNGGLRARAPLHTAILLCLMSDRRAEPEDVIPDGSGDPRGWAGDAIDSSLAPLGSRLWLLRRSALTEATAALADVYARESLQTLLDQKVAAALDVSTLLRLEAGRLELSIALYREGGGLAADMNFWLLWDLSNGILDPLAP